MSRTLPRSPYLLTQAIYGHPPANKRPPKVDPSDRVARALSYLLQGGAKSEGLTVRSDGYVDVHSLLSNRILRGVDFTTLEAIVHSDRHSRFHILYDVLPGRATSWWIRANQKHSTPVAQGLKPIGSAKDIKMAVHGTSMRSLGGYQQGLSRMSRNHIHLAQGFAGERIRGMKNSSEVLIFIDVARALKEDIKFYLSTDGAVLTPGN
ncbi:phosphotransferase KptA/Tpt1 [Mycena vulgaris]|nr:phosphotransferase KptA/Tpt1 [Mycena vulgaris]